MKKLLTLRERWLLSVEHSKNAYLIYNFTYGKACVYVDFFSNRYRVFCSGNVKYRSTKGDDLSQYKQVDSFLTLEEAVKCFSDVVHSILNSSNVDFYFLPMPNNVILNVHLRSSK